MTRYAPTYAPTPGHAPTSERVAKQRRRYHRPFRAMHSGSVDLRSYEGATIARHNDADERDVHILKMSVDLARKGVSTLPVRGGRRACPTCPAFIGTVAAGELENNLCP